MQEAIFYFCGVCAEDMSKIVFDADTLKLMSFFESATRAKVKDCVSRDSELVFVVEMNEMGKAIGRGGAHVRHLEKALKRRVKIVEFNPRVEEFVKNLVFPVQVLGVHQEGELLHVVCEDRSKGLLIGRSASTLRWLESVVQRYFPITEIKIEGREWQKKHAV